MSLSVIHSLFLPLLVLIAVPILLHLFARARPPVYPFSSVEFIRRIVRHTLRIKRPQDWLLLILRTILYAALIAVFLQPLLFLHRRFAVSHGRKNVVLLVDATASMGYMEGAQTRFALARTEASSILSALHPDDTANIVWIRARPEPVFPEMGRNHAYLQDGLRRGRITEEAGDIPGALQAAAELLQGQDGRREIVVVSDFQKSAWSSVASRLHRESISSWLKSEPARAITMRSPGWKSGRPCRWSAKKWRSIARSPITLRNPASPRCS